MAPLLGALCVEEGWSCTLVVATRGEGGGCLLPDGCDPDLATVRSAEMEASAALFGAALLFLELSNGSGYEPYPGDLDDVAARWDAEQALTDVVDSLAAEVADADLVLTFDPRHGVSCHPEHRVTGALALAAVQSLAAPPAVLLTGGLVEPTVPDDPHVVALDASELLPSVGVSAWAFGGLVALAHPSQFGWSTADYEAFVSLPGALQQLHVLDLADVVDDDPVYEGACL